MNIHINIIDFQLMQIDCRLKTKNPYNLDIQMISNNYI